MSVEMRRAAGSGRANRGHHQTIFFFLFGSSWELPECLHHRDSEDIPLFRRGRAARVHDAHQAVYNVPGFRVVVVCGKCRACGSAISPMYPLMELATGLLFVAAFWSSHHADDGEMAVFYVLDPDSDEPTCAYGCCRTW